MFEFITGSSICGGWGMKVNSSMVRSLLDCASLHWTCISLAINQVHLPGWKGKAWTLFSIMHPQRRTRMTPGCVYTMHVISNFRSSALPRVIRDKYKTTWGCLQQLDCCGNIMDTAAIKLLLLVVFMKHWQTCKDTCSMTQFIICCIALDIWMLQSIQLRPCNLRQKRARAFGYGNCGIFM